MVDVVEEADADASPRRRLDCAADDRGGLASEVEVVVREVQRVAGLLDEVCNPTRHVGRGLAAVGQCPHLQHLGLLPSEPRRDQVCPVARGRTLCDDLSVIEAGSGCSTSASSPLRLLAVAGASAYPHGREAA